MKIDFSQTLKTIHGKPIMHHEGGDGGESKLVEVSLSFVAINALMSAHEKDKGLSGNDKFKLSQIAAEIAKNPDADFSVEDLAKIKERIGMLYTQAIIFAAFPLLDATEKKDQPNDSK